MKLTYVSGYTHFKAIEHAQYIASMVIGFVKNGGHKIEIEVHSNYTRKLEEQLEKFKHKYPYVILDELTEYK